MAHVKNTPLFPLFFSPFLSLPLSPLVHPRASRTFRIYHPIYLSTNSHYFQNTPQECEFSTYRAAPSNQSRVSSVHPSRVVCPHTSGHGELVLPNADELVLPGHEGNLRQARSCRPRAAATAPRAIAGPTSATAALSSYRAQALELDALCSPPLLPSPPALHRVDR